MEYGSTAFQREERKKRYNIYVEEYVMAYLKREADSLELSEIYFYGSRQDNGRKIFVYGAGRDKEIAAFAKYELLSELICRLTQAGPVFMVREENGDCKASGFQIFYENNEEMQNYLLEWTSSTDNSADNSVDVTMDTEKTKLPILIPTEKDSKQEVHGVISVQLCLILMVLTAIVITATDSYDKMEQLNQSAKEVFFAIENQEAEDSVENFENVEKKDQIVVEREVSAEKEAMNNSGDMLSADDENGPSGKSSPEIVQSEAAEEDILEPVQGETSESARGGEAEEGTSESAQEEDSEGTKSEDAQEETAEEAGEEALSRSITRYYEVEQGDTLYTISQKIYGNFSKVEEICEVNEITDPDRIRSGQRIILP